MLARRSWYNPIAVAVRGIFAAFCTGYGTSIVPIGRINVYQKEGKEIPSGWGGCARSGDEKPAAVRAGGALMPLGGPELLRGYKGYGLSLMWISFRECFRRSIW